MKKITELKEEKTLLRQRRNEFGESVRVKETIEVNRPVNTITGWARFGHYILDLLIIIGITLILMFLDIIEPTETYYSNGNSFEYNFRLDYQGYIITLIYYLISEATMGRTIGKFATNSFVIDQYGKKPDFGTILGRSLCRWIPFNALSCLGKRGWHDQISKTYVVSQTEWDEIKRIQANDDGFSDDFDILDA